MAAETVTREDLLAEFLAGLPFPVDPFQRQAMEALAAKRSVLVAAPTGTGKTVIAEFGVFQAHRAGLRAIYTTPIKALSNQKYRDFRQVYGDEVGLMTGDVVVNSGGSVLIMTTEVLRNILVVDPHSMDDVGVVVFDEVHYMGDPERGTAWEEAILLCPQHVPLVCLSATVPNGEEIAEWIRTAHAELEYILHEERAVPLESWYYLEGKAYLVVDALGRRRGRLRGVGGELARRIRWGAMTTTRDGREAEPRREAEPWEVVRYLEKNGLTPAIYFLFGRRACEEAAESCLALRPVPHAMDLVREARARLADLPPEDRTMRQVTLLFRLLPRGVAVHHAGMLPVIKMLVEELFASGRLRAVFATETLALGINMPARTVVIGEMVKWDGESRRLLYPNEYRQMVGRAGRRGIDEKGVALILYSPWVTLEQAIEIATGELLPLESAFRPNYNTALNLWHRPEDQDLLADLYARSLRRFQHDIQLKGLIARRLSLEDQMAALGTKDIRDPRARRVARLLAETERDLARTRIVARQEARAVAEGLAHILERYGYLAIRRPTRKAGLLRRIFDTNALTLSEVLDRRYLEGLLPEEIAEVVSWFAYDREARLRPLPLPRRLLDLREKLLDLHTNIMGEEREHGLAISQPLNEDFRGLVLAWAQGRPLAEICRRARVAEGDLVGAVQKTLDILGQIKATLLSAEPPPGADWGALRERVETADAVIRRGVVEASYRWALTGPPTPEETGEAVEWWPSPEEVMHPEERAALEERRARQRRQAKKAAQRKKT